MLVDPNKKAQKFVDLHVRPVRNAWSSGARLSPQHFAKMTSPDKVFASEISLLEVT